MKDSEISKCKICKTMVYARNGIEHIIKTKRLQKLHAGSNTSNNSNIVKNIRKFDNINNDNENSGLHYNINQRYEPK